MVFGAHQASDGTLRFFALMALLLQPEDSLPEVLIIDEPELGLHPSALDIVAGAIRAASLQCQIILCIATGSTSGNVILSLAAGDVITLRNNSAVPMTLALSPSVAAQITILKLN